MRPPTTPGVRSPRARGLHALFYGALALSLLAGCTAEPEGTEPPPEAWDVRAVYHGTEAGGEAASVTHEAIPGLSMDVMRMGVLLDRPDEVAGLAPGAKVSFRLALVEGRLVASVFRPLPDSTALDLEPGALAPSLAPQDPASGARTIAPRDSSAAPEADA